MGVNLAKFNKVEKRGDNRFMTPWFRGAFVNVWKVEKPVDGKEPDEGYRQFSLTMLFDEEMVDLTELKKAVAAEAERFFKGKVPKNFKNPFRDGNEKEDLDGYAGMTFARASTYEKNGRPTVVDEKGNVLEAPAMNEPDPACSGYYFRAIVSPSGFDNSGNKGVKFYLNGLQVLAVGQPFAGRVDVVSEFGDATDGENSSDGGDDLPDFMK